MNHLGDKIVEFLKNAATKIESLQVQTALGKAELSDKLEEIKKDTQAKINQLKADMNSSVKEKKESFNHLKAKIEHLELQIALGKAETIEEFETQKKKLSTAVRDIRDLLSKD